MKTSSFCAELAAVGSFALLLTASGAARTQSPADFESSERTDVSVVVGGPFLPGPPCVNALLHVDCRPRRADSSPRGVVEGTVRNPFRSISAAVRFAASPRFCGSEIHVAAGTCEEIVAVEKPTWIQGAGQSDTIVKGAVFGGADAQLALAQLTIADSPWPAAIAVAGQNAVVSVSDVRVIRALGVGIHQSGGLLRVERTSFEAIQSAGVDTFEAGAIRLADGVSAELKEVDVSDVQVAALVATGAATLAHVDDFRVADVARPPRMDSFEGERHPLGTIGAIEVREGATLLAWGVELLRSRDVGLFVGADSRAFVDGALIDDQGAWDPGEAGAWWYGYGIYAAPAAEVQIYDFELTHGRFGLYLDGAYVTARNGLITENGVGVNLVDPPTNPEGYRWKYCLGLANPAWDVPATVSVVDNWDQNFKNDDLLVAPAPPPLWGESDPTVCDQFAWLCPEDIWCVSILDLG